MAQRCPYCGAHPDEGLTIRGKRQDYHLRCCKELRALDRIDVIVAGTRHFQHTKTLLGIIFHKRSKKQ